MKPSEEELERLLAENAAAIWPGQDGPPPECTARVMACVRAEPLPAQASSRGPTGVWLFLALLVVAGCFCWAALIAVAWAFWPWAGQAVRDGLGLLAAMRALALAVGALGTVWYDPWRWGASLTAAAAFALPMAWLLGDPRQRERRPQRPG